MLFGDPKDFAIEAYHEPAGPEWRGFGRMALRFSDVTLGDIKEPHCSLFHAVKVFRRLIDDVTSNWDPDFLGHSDDEIFAQIDKEVYEDYGQSDADIKLGQIRYGRFDFLTNVGEQFDCCKTFLYASPTGEVHVLYQLRDGTVRFATCSIASFISASRAFVEWFDIQCHLQLGTA